MSFLLAAFDDATCDAFARAGAPPAIWISVGSPQNVPSATEAVSVKDIIRSTLSHASVPAVDQWPLLDTVRNTAREMFRRSLDRKVNYTSIHSWLDGEAQLNNILYHLHALLRRHPYVDTIIFHNIPHEPVFIVLYYLAKAMDKRTIITCQTQFPNYFFLLSEIDDYGEFEKAPVGTPTSINLPARPSSPFYMKDMKKTAKASDLLKHLSNIATLTWSFATLPFGGNPYKFQKFFHKVVYYSRNNKFIAQYYTSRADFSQPYIYVPLHRQPEMTIDVLGGKYGDPARAIEELSVTAPGNWMIYVKENPKQTATAREPRFFRRLNALSNVKLVRPDTDTFELIRNAKCVATWSGTAGWEALLMGKPSIVFGLAWYRCLPGVVEWQDGVDFDALDTLVPTREKLAAAFHELTRHMRQGVVDPKYSVIVENFDRIKNGELVADALLDAMHFDSKHQGRRCA
jgi:hypothetical protein